MSGADLRWGRSDWRYLAALLAVAVSLWLPRLRGPLDLRYDAGVYYILGTSLAQGRGYRLLNEPGAIQAIQYPPVVPAVAAVAQRVLGTDDPAVVGHWLRLGSVLLYAGYAAAVYVMARRWLAPGYAFLVGLLTVIHSHTIFLSDFFAADIPYAFLSTLFFSVGSGALAGLLAVAAYGIRSAGIALLTAWVAESLLRRRIRQAAVRGAVAAAAVLTWMTYTNQVKASPAFSQPTYEYQRAGYQFYNVDYAENMSYVDPFRPELGRVSRGEALDRLLQNLKGMPMTLGEGVSVHRGWWHGEVEKLNQRLPGVQVPTWVADAAMILLCVPVIAGLVLLALRGEFLLVLYVAASVFIIAVTPWPIQFVRYLVPLTPFLTLALVLVLAECEQQARRNQGRWRAPWVMLLGVVVLVGTQQLVTLYRSISKYPSPAVIADRAGNRHDYRLFFYDRTWRLHDDGLDWLALHGRPGEIVATSTPHWAYLRTGLLSIMPPYEADPRRAARLLDQVPVTYLIVDQLSFLDVGRRYTVPAILEEPDRWRLIYGVNDSGPKIYRRVAGSAK